MKSIINGVRYDTEKATLIGEASGGNGRSDWHHWEAGLYISPRAKRFFLAGSGGPMSRYSRSAGIGQWTGSERIDPLTREEAYEWAEQFLAPEVVAEHFADMIEDA